MRRWIGFGAMGVAVTATAVAIAVPAMAQQSGAHHHAPVLTAVPGVTSAPKATPATAVPLTAKPVIVGPAGVTGAACGITLTPVSGAPDPATVIPATPKPLKHVSIVVCGPSGTTTTAGH